MLHSTSRKGELPMTSEIQAITTLIEESKLTEAQIKIDQALANLSYSPQLYCLAIQVSILSNNLESAFTYANDAIKLFPDDPDILNNTARILLDFKKSTKSIGLFEKAILNDSKKILFKLNLYEANIIFNRKSEAEKILKKIYKSIDIKNIKNQQHLIQLFFKYKQKKQITNLRNLKESNIDKNIFWTLFLKNNQTKKNKKTFLKLIQEAKDKKIDKKVISGLLGDYLFKIEKDFSGALLELSKLILLDPNDYKVFNRIGLVFKAMGDIDSALESFKKCYQINNKFAPAIGNLAVILIEASRYNDAIKLLKEAINIAPSEEAYLINAATCYHELGNYTESQEYFDRALEINPSNDTCRIFKIFNQANNADWSYAIQERFAVSELGLKSENSPPYQMLMFDDNPKNQLTRAKLFSNFQYGKNKKTTVFPELNKSERIKVGLFSADFHDFPGMHLMIGILEKIDKTKFEIIAYSYGPDKKDYMRTRIIEAVHSFVDISGLSDIEAASLSKRDGINIAIHRNGYTKNHRTGIFSHGAAPIQINYLGHPSTLGADFIDYIIADKVVIPNEFRNAYSENVIYMPHTYQPTDNTRPLSGKYKSRSDCQLPSDSFVLCCFNATRKISLNEFSIWMKILNEKPKTVLWLLKSSDLGVSNLKKEAKGFGVDSDRLIFADRVNQYDHLDRHRFADLFIDNFTYNAHTTASDALWAGVPIVTKIGRQFSSRVAASLLTAIDLPELITHTNLEYENLISKIVCDSSYLLSLRAKLEQNKLTTSLFDTNSYTRNFEIALEKVWKTYMSGKPNHDIFV